MSEENKDYRFSLKESKKYARLYSQSTYAESKNVTTTFTNFMIREATIEDSTYEPYHEPKIVEIDLNGNSIAKVSDTVKDKLEVYRNGKVILEKKIEKITLNGSESGWIKESTYFKIKVDNLKQMNVGPGLCNFFINANKNFKYDDGKIRFGWQDDYIYLYTSKFEDIDNWKIWLSTHNLIIYYPLATSQTIELPSIEKIELWEGTVNVELISNLATNLNVNYNIVPDMPSLEAKAEINSIDDVNIRICNENLAYEGWAEDFVSRINDSSRAHIVTKDERNCLWYSASAGYGNYDNKYLFKTHWKENTQYTFIFDIYITFVSGYANLCIQYTDGTLQELMNLKTNDWNKINFKSKVNKTIKYLRANWRGGSSYIDLDTFAVYEGTEISQYIPNQTNNFQVILNKPLRGLKIEDKEYNRKLANYIDENGNYWACDYIADDGIHRRIKRKIFDGTENFEYDAGTDVNNENNYSSVLRFTDGASNKTDIMCNYFQNKAIYAQKDITGINLTIYYLYFSYPKTFATTQEQFKEKLKQLYENGNPLYIDYIAKDEELEEFTEEERNTYEQLQNIQLFEGKNYINAIDNIEERFRIDVSKIIDGYYSYISNDGYFIVPELDIKYLVDFNESDIPTMPEANETTVKVAGRDGDIPLSTTYEAIPFNIVCYTEDNLSLAEKVKEENKVNNFLNSIKNKTMTFAFEKYNKFYNVKYSGELTTINYPKCVKFTIPLKSSESYGKALMQKMMVGNSEEESNTVKEVGGIITLGGPATNPIVSLNDYSIEYNNSILKGSRVEIDSNKSTITNINSDGVKTNVMKFYNHQFPKIENGKNTLKVLSGFDNDKQVSLKWNDLKL